STPPAPLSPPFPYTTLFRSPFCHSLARSARLPQLSRNRSSADFLRNGGDGDPDRDVHRPGRDIFLPRRAIDLVRCIRRACPAGEAGDACVSGDLLRLRPFQAPCRRVETGSDRTRDRRSLACVHHRLLRIADPADDHCQELAHWTSKSSSDSRIYSQFLEAIRTILGICIRYRHSDPALLSAADRRVDVDLRRARAVVFTRSTPAIPGDRGSRVYLCCLSD